MKYLPIFLLCLLLSLTKAHAQKNYFGCPEKFASVPDAGFLAQQPINLMITHGTLIPENCKVEGDEASLCRGLAKVVQADYPSAKITLLADTGYNPAANPGGVTIKIQINAYQASLAKMEWTGSVNYQVTIFDNRSGHPKKVSEAISNDTTKPTVWGFKVAKTCLFTSFDKSNQDLAAFIRDSLK